MGLKREDTPTQNKRLESNPPKGKEFVKIQLLSTTGEQGRGKSNEIEMFPNELIWSKCATSQSP